MTVRRAFDSFAKFTARYSGHPAAFALAVFSIATWATLGPLYRYSDSWQLVINTGTTIVTFLMVFLIQNSQNRDNAAMQVKLGEVIRALRGAKNEMINLDDLTDDELAKFQADFAKLAREARLRADSRRGRSRVAEN